MIVVADAGSLHYFVLIGAVDVLRPLYVRVLVPQTVADEPGILDVALSNCAC